METLNAETPATREAAPPHPGRIAFERLRERTDELELLISGLFAFALVTVPGGVFNLWVGASVHVAGIADDILRFGCQIAIGLGYALALAFIAHLAIRAYWIGLIGLKSAFPGGIRWDRVPMIGSVSRPYYEREIGDLGQTIDRIDRVASILFAMTTLVALLLVWVGVLSVPGLLLCGLVGGLFDDSQRATVIAMAVSYALFLLVGLSPTVLERVADRREAAGRPAAGLRRLAERLLRVVGWVMPQRLISAVQFTLQSNLPGHRFMAAYIGVFIVAMGISALAMLAPARLALLDSYAVLTDEAIEHGLRGAHYESLRSDGDRMAVFPMIPSERVTGSHLRLFIPHLPRRDNPLARERCQALAQGRNLAEGRPATVLGQACVARLWQVELDGQAVSLDDFVAAERRDLGMRGLMGYIEVAGLRPGLHRLSLLWNAEGPESGALRRREYGIPFWYTPGPDPATP